MPSTPLKIIKMSPVSMTRVLAPTAKVAFKVPSVAAGAQAPTATITGIDLTATGATTLLTVPAGTTFHVSRVAVLYTTVTGFSGEPTIAIEIGSGTGDIILDTVLYGTPVVNYAYVLAAVDLIRVAQATEAISLNVTNASASTALVATAVLFGNYV